MARLVIDDHLPLSCRMSIDQLAVMGIFILGITRPTTLLHSYLTVHAEPRLLLEPDLSKPGIMTPISFLFEVYTLSLAQRITDELNKAF